MMHTPPHPGEHIREDYLQELGLSVTEAAQTLGVTRKTLSELVNARAGISADMAIRLEKVFGTRAEIWMRLQAQYDLWQASQRMKSWKPSRNYVETRPSA